MQRGTDPEIEHLQRPEMERGKYPPNVLENIPLQYVLSALRSNEGSSLYDSESGTLCILARFYPLLRRIDDRPLSRDPFTDIRWTISKFDSV
jgi:hypothetical protein